MLRVLRYVGGSTLIGFALPYAYAVALMPPETPYETILAQMLFAGLAGMLAGAWGAIACANERRRLAAEIETGKVPLEAGAIVARLLNW